MKLKNNITKLFLALTFLAFSGCETFDLDQTENPSTLPQSFLDPIFTFNYVQLQLPEFVDYTNNFTQRVTRQMAMTGGKNYDNAFTPELFDRQWTTGYLMLNAIKQMEPIAIEKNQTYILGASKVIRCYVLMTLVDMYGDIPYSEALLGNDNLTPAFDSSASVYAGVYGELNQAIELMERPATEDDNTVRDLYFGGEEGTGNRLSWIKLANSLKLKMLNTARLTGIQGYDTAAEANALIGGGLLIDEAVEDFAFNYGTERDLPNSRHPDYNNDYEFGGGPFLGNYFMWAVSREKAEPSGGNYPYFDIRTQYYFYRQTNSSTGSSQILPCEYITPPEHFDNAEYYSFYKPKSNGSTAIKPAYCTTDLTADGTSFWGRDHGDDSGIPADDESRTVHGLYPAGGKISAVNNATPVANTEGEEGALGQGIMPIIMSSFVHFMKAELMLTVAGVAGDPSMELKDGIDDSVFKVTTFLPNQQGAPDQGAIDTKHLAYTNFVSAAYNSATVAEKLEIIVKEFYIASWGNGIEGYNNYRRTGYPSNMQPTFELESGAYFYTALYPAISVNNNPNAPSNVRSRKVFWEATAGLNLH